MAAHAIPALKSLIGEHIEFSCAFTDESTRIMAYPGEVEQVIFDLAIRARDAMTGGGKLSVELSRTRVEDSLAALCLSVPEGEYVALAVTDTGAGTSRGITHFNSCFMLEHNLPGVGTCVRAMFPAAPEDKCSRLSDAEGGLSGSETILLVEDNRALRSFLRRKLSERGYEVLDAANGEDAAMLAARYQGTIDLLLTDMSLPGVSGAQIAGSITALRPAIEVLRMSGHSELPGLPCQGGTFIQKPFSLPELLSSIREIFDSRRHQPSITP